MKDSHYRISLDIHSTQSQVSLPVKQGDTSRKVFISLCEGGKPYQIEKDCLAVFSAKKPDGKIIENNCVIADNVIEYAITEQTTAASGMVDCEIKLYGVGSGLITSPRFTIIVDSRAVSDKEIEESFSEYSALTELYNELPEFMADVDAELAEGKNVVANALKGSASGDPISLYDVSPVEHEMKVKLRGKNLLTYPYSDKTKKSNGITFTDNVDGSVTIDGTCTNPYNTLFYLARDVSLQDGVTYCIPTSVENGNILFLFAYNDADGKAVSVQNLVTWNKNYSNLRLLILIAKSDPINNVTVYPRLEIGTAVTEYVPPLNPTTVTLTRYGATEADNPKTYTPNPDGTVSGVTSLYPTTTLLTDTEGVTIDVEYNRDANKVIEEMYALFYQGISGRIAHINLLSANWKGTESPYSQVVAIDGVTERSKIDLNPSIEQLAIFHAKDIAFVAENEDGIVTVYCVGQKPAEDYQMQITITEVYANA
jgi:hypothetical protein